MISSPLPLNPMPDGVCRTLKRQYQQTSLANLFRSGGFGATGVVYETDDAQGHKAGACLITKDPNKNFGEAEWKAVCPTLVATDYKSPHLVMESYEDNPDEHNP